MKALAVSNMYPGSDSSFGVFVQHQVEDLRSLGVEVDIAVRREHKNLAYVPFLLRTLKRSLNSKYDIIHAHGGFHSALLVSLLGRVPVICTFHGGDALSETKRFDVYYRLQRYVVSRSELLISVSNEVKARLIDVLGADHSRVFVIPCGVDTQEFVPRDRSAARKRLGIEEKAKVVTFCGRLVRGKGIDTVYECARRLRDLRFLIIGRGKPRENATNCTLTGLVPHSVLPLYLGASDIFLLPTYSEGTPVSLLEAMSCGLPVVSTRVGGIPDIVQHGVSGFLASPGDTEACVKFLSALIADDTRRAEMGRAARASVVVTCDRKSIARRLLEIYGRAVEQHKRRR